MLIRLVSAGQAYTVLYKKHHCPYVAFSIKLCVLAARRDRKGKRKYSAGRELIYKEDTRFENCDSDKTHWHMYEYLASENASCLCLRDVRYTMLSVLSTINVF
jgi:hypothetical protein